jgi:hypothetical protein
MLNRSTLGTIVLAAALAALTIGSQAQDLSKYPDWSGIWRGDHGPQWDPSKRPGLAQQPPLTPEYQAIFEASLKDQEKGGQGNNVRFTCMPSGMPRTMTVLFQIEFVVTPKTTFLNFSTNNPTRRIYTDGRDWPKNDEPSFSGYSLGRWLDTDGDGKYDTLEVETRNIKGHRTYDNTGLPLHEDNQTIVKERIYVDKARPDRINDEITTIDHALMRPWTVTKSYIREKPGVPWIDLICNENNPHVVIGGQNYFLSYDGFLMPARKDQSPPDLRYFNQTRR